MKAKDVKPGDVVRWKTPFDFESPQGATLQVQRRIKGTGGAWVGLQLPEKRSTIFYANEVDPVTVEGGEVCWNCDEVIPEGDEEWHNDLPFCCSSCIRGYEDGLNVREPHPDDPRLEDTHLEGWLKDR